MHISYKQDNFLNKFHNKNIKDGLFFKTLNFWDENPSSSQYIIYCEPFLLQEWENVMKSGNSPLEDIKRHFPLYTPIFNISFLDTLIRFTKINPSEAANLIDYILCYNQPQKENLDHLDWRSVFQFFISNLPYSLSVLSHALIILDMLNMNQIQFFLDLGGIPKLYPHAKYEEYKIYLSLCLLTLSNYDLKKFKYERDNAKSEINFNEVSSPFEIRSEDCDDDGETLFNEFCENILVSNNINARINALNSFFNLCTHDKTIRAFISNIILTYLDKFSTIEEKIPAIKLLSISLRFKKSSKIKIFPYFDNILKITTEFNNTNDDRLIDSICALFKTITNQDFEDYIFKLGVIHKVVDIVSCEEISFLIRKNALKILLKILGSEKFQIIGNCNSNHPDDRYSNIQNNLYYEDSHNKSNNYNDDDHSFSMEYELEYYQYQNIINGPSTPDSQKIPNLSSIVNRDILSIFINYLDLDDPELIKGILYVINKILHAYQFSGIPDDLEGVLYNSYETFEVLSNSDNEEIRAVSNELLSYLNSCIQY